MPSFEGMTFSPRLAARARTIVSDRQGDTDLSTLAAGTCLGGAARGLVGRAILIATRTQTAAALAMVELDGLARRIAIAPPDLKAEDLPSVLADAEIEAIVTDDPRRFAAIADMSVAVIATPCAAAWRPGYDLDTEWVLLTSGTSGRPKMVGHTLAVLTGAITSTLPGAAPKWATFYDIRRYGGLQIFLRAILGGTGLVVSDPEEAIGDHLHRLGAAGVTAISGTPSHWRRVLMSHERTAITPAYVRLSGEIADQLVLDGLRATYPEASIDHAYASTEAGVGFAVDDGREGFPAKLVDEPAGGLDMKVVDGSLRIRSPPCRVALHRAGRARASRRRRVRRHRRSGRAAWRPLSFRRAARRHHQRRWPQGEPGRGRGRAERA